MLGCPHPKPPSHIPSFLQGEDGRPGPEGDRGPAVSTPLPQLHPNPGPFLTTPLFSPSGLAWEPWGAWGQGKGLCGLRRWGENDASPGTEVPREVLPAPWCASLQHLTSSSQGDLGAPGPKGDKVSPWGRGQWEGGSSPGPPSHPHLCLLWVYRVTLWWWRGHLEHGAARGSR